MHAFFFHLKYILLCRLILSLLKTSVKITHPIAASSSPYKNRPQDSIKPCGIFPYSLFLTPTSFYYTLFKIARQYPDHSKCLNPMDGVKRKKRIPIFRNPLKINTAGDRNRTGTGG